MFMDVMLLGYRYTLWEEVIRSNHVGIKAGKASLCGLDIVEAMQYSAVPGIASSRRRGPLYFYSSALPSYLTHCLFFIFVFLLLLHCQNGKHP